MSKNPQKPEENSISRLEQWRRNNPDKVRAASKRWALENPERVFEYEERRNAKLREQRKTDPLFAIAEAERKRKFRQKLKLEMFVAYGGCCSCCGETNPLFLQIDHIENDGHVERNGRGNNKFTGWQLCMKLKRLGWPKDRYQLLCANCNIGKQLNFGVCPHKGIISENRSCLATSLQKTRSIYGEPTEES